jgi:cell division protein FtsW (lipid II flippase)
MTTPNPEFTDQRESLVLKIGLVFLLLNGIALSISPLLRSHQLTLSAIRWDHLSFLPAWALTAWLAHRTLSRNKPNRDPYILPLSLTLTGWGLIAVWRVAPEFGARQTGWFLVASVTLIELLRSPTELRWVRRYRYLWLSAGLLLMLLTLLLGTNPTGGGPRLWLGCCGLYFQPSEPLRLLLIAYIASFLSERMALGWDGRGSHWLPTLGPILLAWGLSILLLMAQRDLGTGSLFLFLFAILLHIATGRWDWLVGAVVLGAIGGLISYAFLDVVQLRIQSWIFPWLDPTDSGYQIVQALISFASGGLLGSGPGQGAPGVVPIVHSDFVFSAIVEEWGVIGGLGMIACFALLVGRAIRVAATSSTRFGLILASGIAVGFGLQSILILGGVLRLLPLTGVTLPFVSYGGSSLLTSFIGVGFLLKLSGGRESYPQFQPALSTVQVVLSAGWLGLAAAVGWWGLVRAPILEARTDNPRRVFNQRYSHRGAILDREMRILAQSIGEFGTYQRAYPWGETFATLGYDSTRYGQAGVEEFMDPILRGSSDVSEWDSLLFEFLYGFPESGQDVRTTLDLELQRIVEKALKEKQGGVIVMHALDGDLLTMYSTPAFDPNRIDVEWEALITREDAPLLNRATQGAYQPGLILAPIVLWTLEQDQPAALENQFPLEQVNLGDQVLLECLISPGDGSMGDLSLALQYGCPRPFAEIVKAQGEEWLLSTLRNAGFFDDLRLRLGELHTVDEIQYDISDLELESVGQGELQVSALQIASTYSGILYGVRPSVHLVGAYQDRSERWQVVSPLNDPIQVGEISLDDALWEVTELTSKGYWAYAAEAVSSRAGAKTAWYIAALSYENMPIVLVVVLENAEAQEARQLGEELVLWMQKR